MYIFVSLEKISYFLIRFGIDISLFSQFELSLVVLLSNIFMLLFYIIILSIFYKALCRLFRWL